MAENQRESFRIEGDPMLRAELFHEGRVAPCSIENLSAGGASLTSTIQMQPGSQCTLGVRLDDSIQTVAATYVSFLMEVLEASPAPTGTSYRLRNTTGPGTPEFEAATKLVFEAQRLRRAGETGTGAGSPMATDEDRRRDLRSDPRPRFSKGSLRPGGTP